MGGSSAGWVGLKLWTPPPLIILRVPWVGLQPPLLSLVTGALSGCLLMPPSALPCAGTMPKSLCGCGALVGASEQAKRENLKSERHKQWEKAKKSQRPLTFPKVTPVQPTEASSSSSTSSSSNSSQQSNNAAQSGSSAQTHSAAQSASSAQSSAQSGSAAQTNSAAQSASSAQSTIPAQSNSAAQSGSAARTNSASESGSSVQSSSPAQSNSAAQCPEQSSSAAKGKGPAQSSNPSEGANRPFCYMCHPLGLGCRTRESALASIWFAKNAAHRIIRGGGVWVGQKSGGWVQSWVGGSCPKYPPPSYKRSLPQRALWAPGHLADTFGPPTWAPADRGGYVARDVHHQDPHAPSALGDLKSALRGGGGGVTWTPAEGGGGVGEMGFRVGPFVLCKNGCWR